jgi:hypothetical protein
MTLMYTLSSASAATGVNRSTIWRCIKAGKLSGQRDAQGTWAIDPAELHRVFPPLPSAAMEPQGSVHHDAMADALVAELRSVIADLRQDRDHWRSLAQQQQQQQQCLLAIAQQQDARPANRPDEPKSDVADSGQASRLARAWRWMRASA